VIDRNALSVAPDQVWPGILGASQRFQRPVIIV